MSDQLDLTLGPEWAILETLCLGSPDDRTRAAIDALLAGGTIDWDELLGQALRHQLVCLLAHYVDGSAARHEIPFYITHHLDSTLDLNRWRMSRYRAEAMRVGDAFSSAGVDHVATKGISFEATVYSGDGERMLKDVDFMILPSDRDRVAALMEDLGFSPGVWDRRSGTIAPHPRRDRMRYLLQPDHLPRYARPLDDRCVPYIYVDIANSLTWNKSPYEVPVGDALAGRIRRPVPGVDGDGIHCFDTTFELLFTVLHLFREAWLENWMELGIDVSLMKFGDVARLVRSYRRSPAASELAVVLDRYSVVEPVAWVLEHLDRTFGTDSLVALGLEGRVDEGWLGGAHPVRGRSRSWTGRMRERLYSRHRADLFTAEPD